MTDLLIRNLDASVIAGLTRRAAQNQTSPEEEARRTLADAAAAVDVSEVLANLRAVRESIGPLPGPSSTELLRRMRYGDDDEDAAAVDLDAVLRGLEQACALNGPQSGPTSTEMLRWDRDRDERALFELGD